MSVLGSALPSTERYRSEMSIDELVRSDTEAVASGAVRVNIAIISIMKGTRAAYISFLIGVSIVSSEVYLRDEVAWACVKPFVRIEGSL